MGFNISFELGVEDLKHAVETGALEAFLKVLVARESKHSQEKKNSTPVKTENTEKDTQTESTTTQKKDELVTEVQSTTDDESEVPITLETIRAAFMAKNAVKGNTEKLKTILDKYGVKKVSDLQEDDFPAVLKDLEEI